MDSEREVLFVVTSTFTAHVTLNTHKYAKVEVLHTQGKHQQLVSFA